MLAVLALPLVEVGRRDLLELAFAGVDGEAGKALGTERLREGASAQLGFAVVRQLEIRVDRDSGCARIADIQGDADFIAVAPERVYLLHLRAIPAGGGQPKQQRSEEHTSELQSLAYLVCRLLLEKKKTNTNNQPPVLLARHRA